MSEHRELTGRLSANDKRILFVLLAAAPDAVPERVIATAACIATPDEERMRMLVAQRLSNIRRVVGRRVQRDGRAYRWVPDEYPYANRLAERNAFIYGDRQGGATFTTLSAKYGITRSRAMQIVDWEQGHRNRAARAARRQRNQVIEAKFRALVGSGLLR